MQVHIGLNPPNVSLQLQLLTREPGTAERGMINDRCENETRLYQQHLHLLMAWPQINLHSCSSRTDSDVQ